MKTKKIKIKKRPAEERARKYSIMSSSLFSIVGAAWMILAAKLAVISINILSIALSSPEEVFTNKFIFLLGLLTFLSYKTIPFLFKMGQNTLNQGINGLEKDNIEKSIIKLYKKIKKYIEERKKKAHKHEKNN